MVTHSLTATRTIQRTHRTSISSSRERQEERPAGEMAQEGLRLVCPPVSAHEGRLPRQYTLEGQGAKKDISPPLEWYGVPDGTRSLAVVVQDIDADERVPWTHWVVANISPEEKGLPEGFSGAGGNANAGGGAGGVQEGVNDWKQPGWRGPVPDSHGHRIQFRLYALDDVLSLGNKVTVDKVMEAIEGHVLGEAEITAVF
ncbi:UPF0098 protein CPn_0877/CP_0992/CPj0877/CpB0906-like [Triticum dicoccoides]|uniref:UPF0098 protein CPn_0877/CP_0992/CPj0877/CpB0906-like n=1 Tax=Triticum dicoccoides TaxID=85692 RepID=UPI00188F82DD|nr:UPF0098 protein CPn_0877/CP_0992/CPj0877/CpB0906-like [Triticum dicoccoides]